MTKDLYDDPDFLAFRKNVLSDLVPKMQNSGIVVSLVPEGESDVKFAIELGFSVMMDKPIIAVVKPGVHVSAKLAKVVDHWVEGDISTPAGRELLQAAIDRAVSEVPDNPPSA